MRQICVMTSIALSWHIQQLATPWLLDWVPFYMPGRKCKVSIFSTVEQPTVLGLHLWHSLQHMEAKAYSHSADLMARSA
jgi:hypothetical protein